MNKASFEKILVPLNVYWEGMDKSKKIRLGIVAALVLLAIIVSAIILSKKDYAVLYNNLDTQEAGEILNVLQEKKIDAVAQGQGTILVPDGEQDAIRMMLSTEGYPKNALNYDVFQNSTGFGTTEFEKQKYFQFQLQERLQNSIKSLETVEDAIVTINIPNNSSFVLQQDKQNATASVLLKLANRNGLTDKQIKGIEGLVAMSVPGLSEEHVYLIDSMGNSLKSRKDGAELVGSQLDLENSMSDTIQRQVLNLLEPVFGLGRVTAGVRVVLDFDKKTTESILFEPVGDSDEGIPISSSFSSEESSGRSGSGNVGQDPNGGAPLYAGQGANSGEHKRVDRTINYEVNQIRDIVQKAEGTIKDISVSVLLDETYLNDPVELQASVQKVNDIVAGAIGVSRENVTVQSMAFSGANDIARVFDEARQANDLLRRQEFLRNAIIFGIIGVILLFVLFFVLRKNRSKESEEDMVEQYIGSGGEFISEDDEHNFDINKSEKRAFIEKSINKNPELVAQLLRNWLNEEVL